MTAAQLHSVRNAHAGALSRNVHRGLMSYHAGLAAEDMIARDYTSRGHRIVAQRWRGRGGEIDLIVQDENGIVFVEVKQSRDFDTALSHVRPAQVQRLYAAGEEFLATRPDGSLTDVRFDLALVNGSGAVQILQNAFGALF